MKEGDVVLTPLPQANGVVKTGRLSLCAECHPLETGLSAVSARNCASEWLNWMKSLMFRTATLSRTLEGGFSYSSRFSRCDANCKIPRRHWLDIRRTQSASSQKAFGLSASAVSFCDIHRFFAPNSGLSRSLCCFRHFLKIRPTRPAAAGRVVFPNPIQPFNPVKGRGPTGLTLFNDGEAIRGCPNPRFNALTIQRFSVAKPFVQTCPPWWIRVLKRKRREDFSSRR